MNQWILIKNEYNQSYPETTHKISTRACHGKYSTVSGSSVVVWAIACLLYPRELQSLFAELSGSWLPPRVSQWDALGWNWRAKGRMHPECFSPSFLFGVFWLCSFWDLSSQTGIEPVHTVVEGQNPNHWTAREVVFLFRVKVCMLHRMHWVVLHLR